MSERTIETFERKAAELPVGDWTAHRDLAQEAVLAGYAAELTQEVSNDDADPTPLIHELRFLHPHEVVELPEGIQTDEDPMGGSKDVEQFTPGRPHGYFGQRTPLEFSPIQEDWPEMQSVALLHGTEESRHTTLSAALDMVLHGHSDLAWIPPNQASTFDQSGPLRSDNPAPLLVDVNGAVQGEHVLDALRAVAEDEGTRIVVGTGNEHVGSVFTGTFEADGSWSLQSYSVEAGSVGVNGSGSVPSDRVPADFSDAFETHAEQESRLGRAEERRAFENAKGEGARTSAALNAVDAQAIGSMGQVLKNRPPAGPRAGLGTSEEDTSLPNQQTNSQVAGQSRSSSPISRDGHGPTGYER